MKKEIGLHGMNKYACENCGLETYNLIDIFKHEKGCTLRHFPEKYDKWKEENYYWHTQNEVF